MILSNCKIVVFYFPFFFGLLLMNLDFLKFTQVNNRCASRVHESSQ